MGNTYSDQLKLRQPAIGDTGWDDEINENVQILEVFLAALKQGNSVVSGLAPSDGGGLQVDYAAGVADVGDAKRTIGVSNKTCTASVKNWLYVNSSGTVVISTTAPTGDFCPIAMIDAGAAAIDRIADLRFFGEVHIGYKSDGMRYAADAEASDTYVITLSPAPAAYYTGMTINFKANTANTGACTINVNGLGAKTIKKKHDQDLADGDIESGQVVTIIYDGTNFQMQSQPASNVVSGSAITDNRLVRGDGGAQGVQETTIIVSDNGEMTNPSQPAFNTRLTATLSNVTGDGTTYSITGAIWTEYIDQGNNIADGTFTAPVTGQYQLSGIIYLTGITANHITFYINIETSNRTYLCFDLHARNISDAGVQLAVPFSQLVDMDANDTAHISVKVSATDKTVNVYELTHFQGVLIC